MTRGLPPTRFCRHFSDDGKRAYTFCYADPCKDHDRGLTRAFEHLGFPVKVSDRPLSLP